MWAARAAGGIADIVASTMAVIWRNVDQLDSAGADAADLAFRSVLAAAAGAGEAVRDTSRETLDATLRASINRYVVANLAGPDLSASSVARRFGISVRKLHHVYSGSGRSFAQTVMALRVEACARDLASGTRGLPLAEVASRWGFCDQSHLNRVFRAHYGCLPSELRGSSLHAGPIGGAVSSKPLA